MGKGEIARYEQFLLFPQCFQKACFLRASKGVIVWEWDKDRKKSVCPYQPGRITKLPMSIHFVNTSTHTFIKHGLNILTQLVLTGLNQTI